jgi:DegV family protein with EDD domain
MTENLNTAKPKKMVLTGSTAQVPQNVAAKLGIEILPLRIYVNGTEYLDGIELTPDELYQKMRAEKIEVKTAAPTVGQYYESFKTSLDQGVQEILCLTLSSKLSADYSSSLNAANLLSQDYPDRKIIIFDSYCAAVPQGLLAISAAQRLNAGQSMDTVINYLETAKKKAGLIAVLETLDYLLLGGRIGKAAYLAGSTLSIVPILTLNGNGVVAPVGVLRNQNSIAERLTSILERQVDDYKEIRLSVMHADALDQAQTLRETVLEVFPNIDIPIVEFTPVMGAHTGPGLVGLGYLYE